MEKYICWNGLDLMIENDCEIDTISEECHVFVRYLIGQEPSNYILRKYIEAHTIRHISSGIDEPVFDKFLLYVARRHPCLTRMIDTYTCIFLRKSLIRKKLVLLLAILETCSQTHSYFDCPYASNKIILCLKMMQNGIFFMVRMVVSILIFSPLYLMFNLVQNPIIGKQWKR